MPKRHHGFLRLADTLLIASINCYQKYLSPRKGWRCAYGVLHGGPGCSGFVKSVIQEQGWSVARPLAQERFRECKVAAQQLRAQNGVLQMTANGQQSGRKRKECWPDLSCDCGFDICAEPTCDHLSCDSLPCDVPFCDCA